MPEWNLADLYPGADCARAAARPEGGGRRSAAHQGGISGQARLAGRGRRACWPLAIEEYERFVELIGRLGSYAGLYYAGNQADPERAKFYGDVSEKLTAISTEIMFFDLELNQIDEAVMAKALQNKRLAHYRPWIDDLRKEKPYQLEEKIERLFHEKSQTAGGASTGCSTRRWRRCASRRRRARAAGARADAEPVVQPGREEARRRRRGAGQGVQGQRAALHADHQYAGQGQGDLRPLARLQGRRR